MSGKTKAKELIDALKAETANRSVLRQELGEAINVLLVKCSALDTQLAQAEKQFALANNGSFNDFVAGLPDVGDPQV